MEVKLDKKYPLEVSVEQAWAVLADIRAMAACMPGAQITEQVDDTRFKGTVRSKVGPAVMNFGGDVELLCIDAEVRQLKLLAKGADKAGSSAAMNLTAQVLPGESPGVAVLAGLASITVSGKLAQFGSRLLVPVSDALLAQFADNFRAAAAAAALPGAAAAAEPGEAQAAAPAGSAPASAAPSALPSAPSAPSAAPAPAAPSAPQPVKELNALALMWTVIKSWFAGLFGRKH